MSKKLRTCIGLGLLALLVTLAAGMLPTALVSSAQGLPPRPVPVNEPPVNEPPVNEPPVNEPTEGRRRPTPEPLGRITGTVINTVTGAPAPNVTVYVGGWPTTTDSNGNYLRDGLKPGVYSIWIGIGPEPMVSEHPLFTVNLAAGATLVQHLRVRR